MIAEIRFDCSECGQPIAADSAAAGLAACCPTCRTEFVVPALGGINDRDYGSSPRKLRRDGLSAGPGLWQEIAFCDDQQTEPSLEESTSCDPALSVALESAREEISSLWRQVETGREECERLHASATHSQAELKSFQAERLAQRTDLANIRQRLATTEAHLAANEEMLAVAEDAARQLRAECANLQGDLQIAKERATATETQLKVKERQAGDLQEKLQVQRASEHVASREVASLQAESALLRQALDLARSELASATLGREQLAATELTLRETQQKLIAAEKGSKSLSLKCEGFKLQATSLQRDLKETKTGRSLMELRSQLADADNERQRLRRELLQLAAESAKWEEACRDSNRLLKQTRKHLEEAAKVAEAASEPRIRQDNEILRGIIARQNAVLESRHAEIVRYKRARWGVRFVYALFALAMAGILAALLQALPLLGI